MHDMRSMIFYYSSLHDELMMVVALAKMTFVLTTYLDMRHLMNSLMKEPDSFRTYSYS